jgi:hypothetical protein
MRKIRYYIGLDAHKRYTNYAIRNEEGIVVLEGRCASIGKDLYNILEPYLGFSKIGLESNLESYPIYDYFRSRKVNIVVGNTIQLRTLIAKNDRLDARRLSDMLRLNSFPISYIPEGKQKYIRVLVKTRHTVLTQAAKLQVQIKSSFRRNGLVMSHITPFTKAWLKKFKEYLSMNYIPDLVHLYEMYVFMDNKLKLVTKEMVEYAKENFAKEFDAITKRKGIGDVLASYFISEICPISRFSSEKKLRRYAGVIPVSQSSAEKTYSTFIPKASSRGLLRWALVQASHCVTKFDHNMKAYYNKKKREKKIPAKAIMCVARSLSDSLYKTLNSSACS